MDLKQYQIVLVNLNPTIGGEMKKTRTYVILSPDEMNRNLHTIVITPMTNSSKAYPTRIGVKHKIKKGWIVLDQVETIDKQKIAKVFFNLTDREIALVKAIIQETYID